MPELAQPAWLWLLALLPVVVAARLRGAVTEGPVRRSAGTVLRCLALACLALALAGPLASGYSRHTDVVLALDVSASVDAETAAQALDFVNRVLEAKPPDARVGLVAFAADAAVEWRPRETVAPLRGVESHLERGATDIGRALEVAAGAFAPGEARRVVLLSDGRENRGDARAAAAVARSLGVEVHAVALERPRAGAEVAVTGITAPPRVRVHEPFRLQVTVHSRRSGSAHLVVLRNGSLAFQTRLDLAPGENAASFVEQAERGGLYEYEAVVNAESDSGQRNNRWQAFVRVDGAPRVLHALGDDGRGRHLTGALEAQGFTVDRLPGTALPATMHELTDYDLVILDDVSGFDLSLAKMELLESYVRDAGGGLLKLGGERSYAAGGYYGTPVESLLPVTMDVRTRVKIPSLAVVFVLDRSGSMGSRSQGEEKITIAKNAALAAIDLLNPLDRVGVLAFDDAQEWIVAPTEVGNRRPIGERVRAIGAGGSTDLVSALEEAVRVMAEQEARIRHLIVLSDGLTGRHADFSRVAERIEAESITMSTVALGIDANRSLMADLAHAGNGRFYYTDDPRNVPRIFTSETMVVSRNLMVERPTQPLLAYPGELAAGFGPGAFPPLAGYQRAFPKPAAQVILASPDQDPLLAAWRHGLGKSVAFTSDLDERWGREWVRWEEFSRFVGQLARWTMRRTGRETFEPRFHTASGRATLEVDVLDGDERFVNGLDLRASVYRPQGGVRRVRLEQVAPGRYRTRFEVPRDGRYYVSLSGTRDGLRVGPRTFGLAVPYSSEYRDLGADRELLAQLAAATGGRLLPLGAAALPEVLAQKPRASAARHRVWQPLLLAALLLLLLEVAVRKLHLPQALQARLARRGLAGAGQAEPREEALRRRIHSERVRHLDALRAGGSAARDDPAVRARLHVAAGRRGRRGP